ncbi:hypothetical protein PG991_013881 [Apiospora marii]|uniref:C2H2-type domain-containing protein n=1 Tax=Apiospora marii TaxID=335849 RepID=A0ABR1R7A0_9PEZI
MQPSQFDALQIQRSLHYGYDPSSLLEDSLSSGLFTDNITSDTSNFTGLTNLATLSSFDSMLAEQTRARTTSDLTTNNFLNSSHIAGNTFASNSIASNSFTSNAFTGLLSTDITFTRNAPAFTGNIYGTGTILPESIFDGAAGMYIPSTPSVDGPASTFTYGWDSGVAPIQHTVREPMIWDMMGTAQYLGPDMESSYLGGPVSDQSNMGMVEHPPTASSTSTSGTASGSSTSDSEEHSSSTTTPLSSTQDSPEEGNVLLPSWTCQNCSEQFSRQQQLRNHLRKHTLLCPVNGCAKQKVGFSSTRDLNRHICSNHENYAEEHDVPSEQRKCDVPGYFVVCRRDNLMRHRETVHKIKKQQRNKRGRKGKLRRGSQ